MAYLRGNTVMSPDIADPRWRSLYIIGGISCLLVATLIVLAIVAFFIWPYTPGMRSTESIFATLQSDRLGGLISLDLPMLLISLINVLPLLAFYVSLKQVNRSYALIALAIGLIAIALVVQSRPLVEIVLLSDQYAAATTDAAKIRYLAAGDVLLSYFSGTAWMIQTTLLALSGLINSALMLRSPLFGKTTAYIGLIISLLGLGFFIPVVGVPLLFLNTIGSVLFYILVARGLLQAWRQTPAPSR
jgi:MFS family permease